MMDLPIGLMSVTFRGLSLESVAQIALDHDVDLVCWSGDVHVGPDDLGSARRAKRTGIHVESYGSYWRGDEEPFDPWLRSAVALGARRMRVWAGGQGSAEMSSHDRAGLASRLAGAADDAAANGVELVLEFHRGTLADSVDSVLQLLADVAARRRLPALPMRTLWQPRRGISSREAVAEIERLGDRIAAVHVFSWGADGERFALADAEALWRSALATFAAKEGSRSIPLMLEFVRDDSPAQFSDDLSTLRSWTGAADAHA